MTKYVRIWSPLHKAYWRPNQCGYTPDVYHAGVYLRETAKKWAEEIKVELRNVETEYCGHPWCGTRTACCRVGCPIKMMQSGNGRWQWLLPTDKDENPPWPDGVRPYGRSGENWSD